MDSRLNEFCYQHKGHKQACYTIALFFSGSLDFSDIIEMTMIFSRDAIVENIMSTNPLLENLKAHA